MPKTQSINGLKQVSQLCPRTSEQEPDIRVMSLVLKWMERSRAWVIVVFVVPSKSQSWIRGMK